MNLIQVLAIGNVDERLVADLCAELATEFGASSEALASPFDPSPARHLERQQYYSTELLGRMAKLVVPSSRGDEVRLPAPSKSGRPTQNIGALAAVKPACPEKLHLRSPSTGGRQRPSADGRAQPGDANPWRLLGVTSLDLYIPTLTYVFGEAQLAGPCAVVSTHRLRQEFYGLPPDPRLLGERLLKEAVHELGHTLELRHCDDYRCAMAPSHAVEWIDLKSPHFCPACRARAGL